MTTIEWTDESWNPIRARNLATGKLGHFCVRVSPGCLNCYAATQQPRYGNPIRYAAQDRDLVEVFLDQKTLLRPLSWKRGRDIFPCSMTDLFGEFVRDEWIDRVIAVALLTPQHTYKVLTKRHRRMHDYFTLWPDGAARRVHVFTEVNRLLEEHYGMPRAEAILRAQALTEAPNWPPLNWVQGVSVEDQTNADERIPWLLKTPVSRRWVSFEPLLDRVNVEEYLYVQGRNVVQPARPALEWGVVGLESGARARPSEVSNISALVTQFRDARRPIFVKQLGAKPILLGSPLKLKDRKGGDPAEWPDGLRIRQDVSR